MANARVSIFDLETVQAGTPLSRVSVFDLEAVQAGTPLRRVSVFSLDVVIPARLKTRGVLFVITN